MFSLRLHFTEPHCNSRAFSNTVVLIAPRKSRQNPSQIYSQLAVSRKYHVTQEMCYLGQRHMFAKVFRKPVGRETFSQYTQFPSPLLPEQCSPYLAHRAPLRYCSGDGSVKKPEFSHMDINPAMTVPGIIFPEPQHLAAPLRSK